MAVEMAIALSKRPSRLLTYLVPRWSDLSREGLCVVCVCVVRVRAAGSGGAQRAWCVSSICFG